MARIGRKPDKYIEAGFTVSKDIQEVVCNYIIENFSTGLVFEDVEDTGAIGIKFHVPIKAGTGFRAKLVKYINKINPGTGLPEEDIKIHVLDDIEWIDAYKKSILPVIIENVVIKPPWVDNVYKNMIELIIEPKMAFGTGSHETTRLCIIEILKNFKKGSSFFDLGCGSGILSILAAKLGAGFALGVDIDPQATENAEENIAINHVKEIVKIKTGSVELASRKAPYDFIAAKLIKSTILMLFDQIYNCLKPGGTALLSGLLVRDKEAVVKMLGRFNISKYGIKQSGEWLAVSVLKK